MKKERTSSQRKEAGQTLVIIAVAMVGLVAMLALAIDGGNMYLERRHVQNAADAAALAAARAIGKGWNDDSVQMIINEYAVIRNGADAASGTYLPSQEPVGGGYVPEDSNGVRVHATKTVSTFFAGMLGLQQATVAANAAAQYEVQQQGCGGYAIWAHGNTCKVEMDWSGGGGLIDGNVHSNGSVKVSGTGKMVTGICEYVTSVQDNTSDITYVQTAYNAEWPIRWYIEDYRPGGDAALLAQAEGKYFEHICDTWKISSSEHTIAEGLHYCHGNVDISGNQQLGHVTIVAEGEIKLSGSDCTYEAYMDGLLFFSNKVLPPETMCNNSVIDMTVQGGTYTGFFYAPNGAIKYASSDQNVVDGGLICWAADISGNGFTIRYNDEICQDLARRIRVYMIQ